MNRKMPIYKDFPKYLQLIFILIFGGFAFYLTAGSNSFYLKWAEEMSFFSTNSFYFFDCMRFAGGLLIYGGTFLTQFFYYPLLGSLIFIGLLFVIQYLSIKAFSIPKEYYPLTFIPGLMLLLSITQLGYVWLTLKSPGYFFSNALGVLAMLLSFWGYRNLDKISYRTWALAIFVIAAYPLLGFYALLTAFICSLHELILYFKDKEYKRFIPILTATLAIVFVPQFYYFRVYESMQYFYIYTAVLPRFFFDSKELILWLPFIFLFLSLILFSVFILLKYDNKRTTTFQVIFSSSLFIAASLFVFSKSYSDENFRAGIKMNTAIENNDWKRVTSIARNLRGTPTRNIVLNNNLALFKQGIDEAYAMNIEKTASPNSIRTTMLLPLMNSRTLFYQYGIINDSYRWCMEDMVEYGKRTSTLKYMVKCAILNGEYELAQKYNSLLSETLFYSKWAQKYQTYIENPSLLEQDEELNAIRKLMNVATNDFEM